MPKTQSAVLCRTHKGKVALSHSRSHGLRERTCILTGRQIETEALDTVAIFHHVDTIATYRHCRQGVGEYGIFIYFDSRNSYRILPLGLPLQANQQKWHLMANKPNMKKFHYFYVISFAETRADSKKKFPILMKQIAIESA